MGSGLRWLLGVPLLAILLSAGAFLFNWSISAQIDTDRSMVVTSGANLTSISRDLEKEGILDSSRIFLIQAKLFGGDTSVKAGEFSFPAGASKSDILEVLQAGDAVRRLVTIPEGLPSILVHERLMAEPLLTGEIPIPAEGSVMPDTYDFVRGEERVKVLARMQAAMQTYMAEAWPKRSDTIAVSSPNEAVALASIVEKETSKPEEWRLVAGLYSNRLRKGMLLQADPTIIYPITRGKPLGRRIKRSEIASINGYNTYTKIGLPDGPITNPGRDAIDAVLNPAETSALYMVADGKRGHIFADTLAEHQDNVEKWYVLRRQRGEM